MDWSTGRSSWYTNGSVCVLKWREPAEEAHQVRKIYIVLDWMGNVWAYPGRREEADRIAEIFSLKYNREVLVAEVTHCYKPEVVTTTKIIKQMLGE